MDNKYGTVSRADAQRLAKLTSVPLAKAASEADQALASDTHEIAGFLTEIERIAVGWERGLYDFNELDALGGRIIKRLFDVYSEYITAVRFERHHPAAYKSFENLADKLRKIHEDDVAPVNTVDGVCCTNG